MLARLWRYLIDGAPDRVSVQWMKHQDRTAWTRGIDAPCIAWPIKKALNESSLWNREKMKKRA